MKTSAKPLADGVFYFAAAGAPTFLKWGLAALFDLEAHRTNRPDVLRMLSSNVQKLNDLFTERFNAWMHHNLPDSLGLHKIPDMLRLRSETFTQTMQLRAGEKPTSDARAYHRMVHTEVREGPRRLHSILSLEINIIKEFQTDWDEADEALGRRFVLMPGGGLDGFVRWHSEKLKEGRA